MSLPPREEFERDLRRRMDMEPSDAGAVTDLVYRAFGDDDRVDDSDIEKDVRSVFYTLEREGLLRYDRETYRNDEGYMRRRFFWYVNPHFEQEESDQTDEEQSVYDTLPRDVWERSHAAS